MNVNNLLKETQKLRWALSQLTPRERQIFMFRRGFYFRFTKRPKTLEETGKRFGVTRERIRQVEEKILERFKEILN